MKKRYSISKEQCTCGISELYDNVANITTCMLLYGPKADLDGDGYAVEVEDGFITKGV